MPRTLPTGRKLELIREAFYACETVQGTYELLRGDPETRLGYDVIAAAIRRHRKQWAKEFAKQQATERIREEARLKGLRRWEQEIVAGLEEAFHRILKKIRSAKFNSQDVFGLTSAAEALRRVVTGGDIRPDFGHARDFEIFWEVLTADKAIGEHLRNKGVQRKILGEYHRRKAIADLAGAVEAAPDSPDGESHRSHRSHRSHS